MIYLLHNREVICMYDKNEKNIALEFQNMLRQILLLKNIIIL